MKKKEDKHKDVDALRQDLEKSKNLFVTGYEAPSLPQGVAAARLGKPFQADDLAAGLRRLLGRPGAVR